MTRHARGVRRAPGADVPLRHSLLLRLLAASSVIALCSIAATAWLVVRGTTRAIQQQQVQQYTNDAHSYDALVGYAAAHTSWADAQPFADALTAGTDRRVTLTTVDRQLLLGEPVTGAPVATIDPLHVDPALLPDAQDQIDARAVGPYALNDAERADQRTNAQRATQCLRRWGYAAAPVEHPSGFVTVPTRASQRARDDCGSDFPPLPLSSKVALDELGKLADACLSRIGGGAVSIRDPVTYTYDVQGATAGPAAVRGCVGAGRRQQLTPYVAPPALLFIHAPASRSAAARDGFALSAANLARTGGVATLVLAVTIAATALVGSRLVRPLRTLTAAAADPAGVASPVPVGGRDEIGALAAALGEQSRRRQRAEEQRKAMVSDIAHELRTPLANLRSWLEATQDGLADPVADPALAAALLGEALQLQRIVDDLQDLAAADAGTLRLHRRQLDAAELLRQAVTAHRGSAEAAGNRLVEHVEGPCPVHGDAVRLTQALGNLIGNAVRHTPPGGTITVSAAHRPGPMPAGVVELQVRDTGSGIAPEDLPHVFDRFWRADPSRTRDTGGSGLGLAIVKHLVEAHGGTVDAAGGHGGATFTIRLPTAP